MKMSLAGSEAKLSARAVVKRSRQKTNISLRSSINKYVSFFPPLLAPFIQKQTRPRHRKATTRPLRIFQIKGHSELKAQRRCGWRRITSLASVCLREI